MASQVLVTAVSRFNTVDKLSLNFGLVNRDPVYKGIYIHGISVRHNLLI